MARVTVLHFAAAREAAQCHRDEFDALDLGSLLVAARERYGAGWSQVLDSARVWVNGDDPEAGLATMLRDADEIAVLPPVSGG